MLSIDQQIIDSLYAGEDKNQVLWLPVLVLDLDSMKCVFARAHNMSDWGCQIIGDDLGVLGRNLALKLDGSDEFQRGTVTGHKSGYLTLVFKHEKMPVNAEKRKEPRYPVTVSAKVCDLSQNQTWTCVITDASQSGCRIEGQGFDTLPVELLVFMDRFEKPVRGQVAWKTETAAGMRLNWNGAKAI